MGSWEGGRLQTKDRISVLSTRLLSGPVATCVASKDIVMVLSRPAQKGCSSVTLLSVLPSREQNQALFPQASSKNPWNM